MKFDATRLERLRREHGEGFGLMRSLAGEAEGLQISIAKLKLRIDRFYVRKPSATQVFAGLMVQTHHQAEHDAAAAELKQIEDKLADVIARHAVAAAAQEARATRLQGALTFLAARGVHVER